MQPVVLPLSLFLYGAVEFKGQLRHITTLARILATGKTGPYPGVTWG